MIKRATKGAVPVCAITDFLGREEAERLTAVAGDGPAERSAPSTAKAKGLRGGL